MRSRVYASGKTSSFVLLLLVSTSFLLLLVRHLLLEAMHLFLVANIVTSKALVTRSDALVPSSFFWILACAPTSCELLLANLCMASCEDEEVRSAATALLQAVQESEIR